MQTRNKKRITGIIALALIFVIAVTAALYFAAFFSPATHSADYVTATVSGDISGGVDVYISGDGVTRDEDGAYSIPSGTDVEITVINNTAVSSELIVNGATSASPNFYEATVENSDISIEVNGSLATEEGTSLFTAYELSDSTDFLALSKILAAVSGDVETETLSTIVSYLAEFGFDDESWYTTDESGNTILNSANATVGSVQTALINAKTALSTAYFRLTGDVMLNEAQTGATTITTGYFGLGSRRGEAFRGVLDFDGYSVTLNMDIPSVTSENFTSSTAGSATHNILSAGLFNYIYGDGTHACAILGADVRGTISLTSGELTSSATNTDYRVYIGGVAGSIGKNVVLDGISSSVSISAQTTTENTPISVYAGGVFGFSGADIDYWSDVSYTGNYSEISVTSSSGSATLPARTVVGALAGVIQNAYVNNFTATLRGANILADSTSNGNAVAGGLAGIIFASSNAYEETNGLSSSLHIRGININASGATVSALTASTSSGRTTIDPDSVFVVEDGTMTSADAAIAGGLIGRVYGTNITDDDFETLYISEIDFGAVSGSEEFTIRSGTSNANSRAMTFAGGVVGYVSSGENFIDVSYNPGGEASTGAEGDAVIFSGNVVVNSVQNGVGPAYAGGIFGYNAFELPKNSTTEYTFNLTSESASLEVTAEQTAETANAGTLYDVCAGLYTSVLPDAYSINNLTFNANNATATARRLAGSTAVGDIAAGAIAGKATGNGNGDAAIQNLTVNLNTCSINAFGYSFDSVYTTGQGNNVYAGGVIGYVRNYGDYDNNNQNNNIGLNHIKITFDRSLDNSDYAVYGIQNAEVASNASDYWSEGYVGGMFGMMESGYAANLTVDGTLKDRTVIYFNGTHDPNTSSVGGLIGATRNLRNDNGTDVSGDSYAVTNSTVTDVHVAGRAYVGTQSTDWRWDIYVGGAIGVFGTANIQGSTGLTGSNFARGITVEDSSIEAIGDEAMLTYAGGVFGGAWWVSSATISDCISRNNSVLASSATFNTFAAGIAGMIQNSNSSITNSAVFDTKVEAITYSQNETVGGSSVKAYAAGICARVYQGSALKNSISNATVSASAPQLGDSYTVIAGIGILDDGGYSYLNDENRMRDEKGVYHSFGDGDNDSGYYFTSTDTYVNNYFVAANIAEGDINSSVAFRDVDNNEVYRYALIQGYMAGNNVENIQSLSNYAIALKGSGQGHITMPSDGEPLEHTMSVNVTFNVYNGLGLSSNSGPIAGRQYQVNIVGNGDFTLNGLTFTPNAQGTYYAQILIDGELLCSYPIIVGNASTSEGVTITTPDFTISSGDGTTTNAYVSSQNSHNYWSSAFGNSTQVDFSNIHTDNFGANIESNIGYTEKPNIGGSIFTIHGNHSKDAVRGTDNKDNYLYLENQIKVDSEGLTGAYIRFEATGSGYLVVKAQTNRIGNAIFPSLYVDDNTHKNKYSEVPPYGVSETEDEWYYSSEATTDLKEFSVYVPQEGTYYFGFIGNGCNIYTLDMQYDGEGAHSANSGTTYFQIYAGDLSKVQNVIVSNSNVYMPKIYLVQNDLLGYVDGGNNDYDDTTISNAATQITQNLGNATSITGVMGYFNVSTTDDGLGLNISPVLGNTTGAALVLVYNCGQRDPYYVIIEVVPNAIVGLSIEPAADTPPRAIADNGYYIYASGETVRLEAEVEYRFSYNRFIVDVEFTRDDSSTSASTVQPNGTVLVSGNSLQTVVVSCSPISDGSAIGNMSATLTIEISDSITVVAGDMSGTSYAPVSDNDAVAGYPFSFTLDPNPGYGLNPFVYFNLNTGAEGALYANFREERTTNDSGTLQLQYGTYTNGVFIPGNWLYYTKGNNDVTTLNDDGDGTRLAISYVYNASTGVYTITLPAELLSISGLSQITINASFQKVYSIMFDLGEWADDGRDNGGINSRYFIYQVKNGTAINSDLYNSITGELGSLFGRTQNRAGFTFKGFYTTTSANTLASYGDSFTEMFKNGDGNSVIRGSMNFYARWNYTVALHAPSGIGIESGLSSSLLEENLKGGTDNSITDNSIIPIDIQHGFSFEITGTYAGTPRVEVYTVGADGALVPLAFTNVNGVYTVNNPEEITGTIHIYVYADNLTLAVSDTMDATQTSIDLRKDGIFTARYTVNYGSGVNAAEGEGHAEDIVFNFDSALPVGTRLRLFYHANGSAVAVGYYEIDEDTTNKTSVAATAFRPLTGSDSSGSGDSATIFAFEGTLTSESLYLVVTLPNNDTDNFSDISSLNITVNAYSTTLTTTPYETAGVTYGDSESGGETGTDTKVQGVTDPENISIEATVNLFNIVHRYGNPSGNTLTFKAENTSTAEGAPEDVRHADKYYVWRIAATDWNNTVNASGATPVITDGYVYIAASTALALNNFSGTIELMEVTNTQYPAAGAIVWTYTSGN